MGIRELLDTMVCRRIQVDNSHSRVSPEELRDKIAALTHDLAGIACFHDDRTHEIEDITICRFYYDLPLVLHINTSLEGSLGS